MNKILFILTVFFYCVSPSQAQEQPEHEKKIYVDNEGKTYINKELPVYIKLSTSPDEKGQTVNLKSEATSKYSNPMYFDSEGLNTVRSPWAVDPNTKNMIYPQTDVIFEVYADGIAPKTRVSYKNNKPTTIQSKLFASGNIEVELNAYDAVSGVEAIFYNLNNQGFKKYENPINLNGEQIHTLHYYAVDNVGNTERLKKLEITVDEGKPTSQIEFKGDQHEKDISGKTSIILSAKDSFGIENIYYRIDEGREYPYSKPLWSGSLSQGEHNITYYAADKVGNKETPKTVSFYVDKTPPTVIEEFIGNGFMVGGKEYSSGRSKMKLTAFDNHAGVKEIYYSINNQEYQLYQEPFYLTAASGNLSIKTYALDNVNNRTASEQSKTSASIPYIDLSGPKLSFSFIGPSFSYNNLTYINKKTKIKLSGYDSESGLKTLEYKINDNITTPYEKPFQLAKEQGELTIKFTGYDYVDNSNFKEFKVLSDTAGPELFFTFSTPASGSKEIAGNKIDTYPAHVTIFLSCTDQYSGFKSLYYQIGDTEVKRYNGGIDYLKTNKTHEIKAFAYDKLNNKASKSITIFVESE